MSYPFEIHGPYGEEHRIASVSEGRPFGTRLVLPDGRRFAWGGAGAVALAVGKLMQAEAPVADHRNVACDVARAVDATSISATLGATAAAADDYAEGIVHVNDATAEGHEYKIKTHVAAAKSTVLTVDLVEDYKVKVALVAATSEVTFTKNPFKSLIICPTTLTAAIAGVARVAVTATYFGWFQRKGPAVVLVNGTLYVGKLVMPSTTTAGAVDHANNRVRTGATAAADSVSGTLIVDSAGAETAFRAMGTAINTTYDIGALSQPIGRVMQVNASTEYALVDLCLD
mgnify:FL=1